MSTHTLLQLHCTSENSSQNHFQLTTMTATLDWEVILLDSQSSVHVFNNRELLAGIRLHPEGKTSLRVYLNGGHMNSKMAW